MPGERVLPDLPAVPECRIEVRWGRRDDAAPLRVDRCAEAVDLVERRAQVALAVEPPEVPVCRVQILGRRTRGRLHPRGRDDLSALPVPAVGGAINGFDLVPGPPDTAPPAAITTLAVTGTTTTQVMLRWTAPADDNGTGGRVTSYDVRYSTATITDANWAAPRRPPASPTPANPGQQETFTVSGLCPQHDLLLRRQDPPTQPRRNVSALSNVAYRHDGRPRHHRARRRDGPGGHRDRCQPADPDLDRHRRRWRCRHRDHLRHSLLDRPITDDASFAAATAVAGLPTPKAAGLTREPSSSPGLAAATKYYFAMKVADEVPNWSSLSNVLEATTLPPDVTPPAAITDLAAAVARFRPHHADLDRPRR